MESVTLTAYDTYHYLSNLKIDPKDSIKFLKSLFDRVIVELNVEITEQNEDTTHLGRLSLYINESKELVLINENTYHHYSDGFIKNNIFNFVSRLVSQKIYHIITKEYKLFLNICNTSIGIKYFDEEILHQRSLIRLMNELKIDTGYKIEDAQEYFIRYIVTKYLYRDGNELTSDKLRITLHNSDGELMLVNNTLVIDRLRKFNGIYVYNSVVTVINPRSQPIDEVITIKVKSSEYEYSFKYYIRDYVGSI